MSPTPINSIPTSPFKVRLTLKIEPDKKAAIDPESFYKRLLRLSSRTHVRELIRAVARRTVLAAIEARFNTADFRVETEDADTDAATGGANKRSQKKIKDESKKAGDVAKDMSTFGGRVDAVLALLKKQEGLTLLFGSIAKLDEISTGNPDNVDGEHPVGVGEQLTSLKTPNILWRQLEFGSGVYAKPRPRLVGKTKEPWNDGSWRFGTIHAIGSKPGNFLRTATMAPYDDGGAFERELAITIDTWMRSGTTRLASE